MKIVFISSLLPTGHYTENLLKALYRYTKHTYITYTDNNIKNLDVKDCGVIKPVWRKNLFFWWDILKELRKDKPDIVHLQHEFTMYGSILTALLFPLLVIFLRLSGYTVVTTLHAIISKKQVNDEFIDNFLIDKPFYINSFTLRVVFSYIFIVVGTFSHRILCHTQLLSNILISDYKISPEKVLTIPPVIPTHTIIHVPKEPYFLYFGYMVRRKGIEYVLKGFKQLIKKYPQYMLVLAGGVIPGQEKAYEELKQYIHTQALETHVLIKGFIEKESTLDELYAKAYAVVIPARISIAASGPLYHAQGYHKCILASNIGNFQEQIAHRVDGFLVENDSWGTSLVHIIEHPELAIKLESGARKKSSATNNDSIARQYSQLYTALHR